MKTQTRDCCTFICLDRDDKIDLISLTQPRGIFFLLLFFFYNFPPLLILTDGIIVSWLFGRSGWFYLLSKKNNLILFDFVLRLLLFCKHLTYTCTHILHISKIVHVLINKNKIPLTLDINYRPGHKTHISNICSDSDVNSNSDINSSWDI